MIDYHKELVKALNTILPTHYEMTLHSGLKTPCISYMETNNYVVAEGEYQGYSRIVYQVKVWANDIALIQKYALEVAAVLRPLGFKRTASGELYDNNSSMIQKIMTFEALVLEEYDLEV
jgi:hypothetical protein